MNKLNLLYESEYSTMSLRTWYMLPVIEKYFNVLYYDENKTYNKDDTLVVCHMTDFQWTYRFIDRGFKILVENLWETFECVNNGSFPEFYQKNKNNILIITNGRNTGDEHVHVPLWMWYNECLHYTHAGGNDRLLPFRKPSADKAKKFLMPIRRQCEDRDYLVDTMSPLLGDAIYSYVERGIYLPKSSTLEGNSGFDDRQVFSDWYEDTYFSVVAETITGDELPELLVSEKSFKPMAYSHPFLLFAMPGLLAFLKGNGFASYDNLFDETYDTMLGWDNRVACIMSNVNNFDISTYLSKENEERMMHNYNRFYDVNYCKQQVVSEVVVPIIEFFNT